MAGWLVLWCMGLLAMAVSSCDSELDASMNGMYDKMIKAVIPVYKKYLTLDDLKEIIKFYETPVGKKLSEMNPKATAEILPIAQQIGMQTMQELMQKAQEKGYLKQQ